MSFDILTGDALAVLRTLSDQSVHCCITSPPYWGLRDYGALGQLGLEQTPEEYVEHLVEVFQEVKRVLRNDGTLWLNLGDSHGGMRGNYTYSPDNKHLNCVGQSPGRAKGDTLRKQLVGIPWRVAFALQSDGWYLRSDIIWSKPNPMPESVTDRPTKAHEYLFLLAQAERYYYDAEAIRENFVSDHASGNGYVRGERLSFQNGDGTPRGNTKQWLPPSCNGSSFTCGKTKAAREHLAAVGQGQRNDHLGRNKRSVWTVATEPYAGPHFATYPLRLIEPCVLAGCPEGGTILDPFAGTGTTGLAAIKHGRCFLGIDVDPKAVEQARARLEKHYSLFAQELA